MNEASNRCSCGSRRSSSWTEFGKSSTGEPSDSPYFEADQGKEGTHQEDVRSRQAPGNIHQQSSHERHQEAPAAEQSLVDPGAVPALRCPVQGVENAARVGEAEPDPHQGGHGPDGERAPQPE